MKLEAGGWVWVGLMVLQKPFYFQVPAGVQLLNVLASQFSWNELEEGAADSPIKKQAARWAGVSQR